MVIRPLDDFTWCAQSVVADNSDPSVWGTWESGWAHSVAGPCIPISSLLTHMVYLLLFFELFSWLQKRFCPPVWPRYDDKYRSNTALEAIALSVVKKVMSHSPDNLCNSLEKLLILINISFGFLLSLTLDIEKMLINDLLNCITYIICRCLCFYVFVCRIGTQMSGNFCPQCISNFFFKS